MTNTSARRRTLLMHLDPALQNRLLQIRQRAREFMKYMIHTFPEYTDHSIDHVDRVIDIANNWLLDDEQKTKLIRNPWENFFLHASIYLHDIGMIEHPALVTPAFQDSEDKREYIRDNHHERSHDLILARWRELDIEDEFQAEIIGRICLGHRKIPLEDPRISRRISYKQTGTPIDVRFLAACVRLLDELDLTFERTPYQIYELLPNKTKITDIEWNKHFSIGGVGTHDHYIGTIGVWCRCYKPDIHRALKQHESKVQSMLNEINRLITPRFKYTQIFYEIEHIGYEPIDYKFRVEASSALEIFVGNPIYSDKASFLRELLQNALDACDLRKLTARKLQPSISVTMDKDFRSITVKDNGVGMDQDWIEKYFLAIGLSLYRSDEFDRAKGVEAGFMPISYFGIGILSCFMVADHIVVRTRKPPADGLAITITDFRNYFDVRKDNTISQGTEVQIVFKDNPVDCLDYMLKNVKRPKWPIEYIYYDGERTKIPRAPISIAEKRQIEFWDPQWRDYLEVSIPFKKSEGYVAVPILREQHTGRIIGLGTHKWVLDPNSQRQTLDDVIGQLPSTDLVPPTKVLEEQSSPSSCTVLQDGIFVSENRRLLPDWAVRSFEATINLVAEERLELSISRNSLVEGSTNYSKLKERISNSVADLLGRLFEQITREQQSDEERHIIMNRIVHGHLAMTHDNRLRSVLQQYYYFRVGNLDGSLAGYYTYAQMVERAMQIALKGSLPASSTAYLLSDEDLRVLLLVDYARQCTKLLTINRASGHSFG